MELHNLSSYKEFNHERVPSVLTQTEDRLPHI